jgi:hypothetical protein
VRGSQAMLRAELSASVWAAGICASYGHRDWCLQVHEPSVTPRPRLPHR